MMATHNQLRSQPPRLHPHAAERWDKRAKLHLPDDPAPEDIGICDPWTAWHEGETVELPRPWSLQGDEARYHHETQVVLCMRNSHIHTVYDLYGPDSHEIVRRVVEQQVGDGE